MLFERRRAERVQRAIEKAQRYYDKGRYVARGIDGAVQVASRVIKANPHLVPKQHRGAVTKGLATYDAIREHAVKADSVVGALTGRQ